MAYLLDTSILARLANAKDAQHAMAAKAVLELHRRGEGLHVTPQVMIEFRNVATRPVAVNGRVARPSVLPWRAEASATRLTCDRQQPRLPRKALLLHQRVMLK